MNDMALGQQLQIYLATSALLASLCLLGLLPLWVLSRIQPFRRNSGLLIKLGIWLPAGIAATLILMLVDNFTYTLFKFGVVSTAGWSRALYGLAFVGITVVCFWRMLKILPKLESATLTWGLTPKGIFLLLAGVLLLSAAFLVSPGQARTQPLSSADSAKSTAQPHILLITADGLDATHLSLYGYDRDTTPQLRELAATSLVAENAFSNFDHTTGSILSIYTGKYPLQTRLFHYPPDILEGQDSYEHLPGLLLAQGYRTVEIGIPSFLETNRMNMLDGFEEIKMSQVIFSKNINTILKVLPSDKALFIDEVFKRVVDRVRHVFFINTMVNPYLMVTRMSSLTIDTERWEMLKQEVRSARKPLFIHIHLMVTHGKTFNPRVQKFSAGQSIETQKPWNQDLYDDAILDFDANVGELVDFLTDEGVMDNTILIIGSDHGQQWDLSHRVPLLIRFPHGQYAARLQSHAQNLDIAPTVLDYVGLDQPDWMPGRSLIDGDPGHRPIFSLSAIYSEDEALNNTRNDLLDESYPFDTFLVNMAYCQKWYQLEVTSMSWESGTVEGSTSTCPPESQISDEQALEWITAYLEENSVKIPRMEP